MPENKEAAEVYMMTRNQVVTAGMGQPIDISISAVKTVMDLWGVRDQKKCLSRVISTFHHFNKENK